MMNAYVMNTLQYNPDLCINCGMCSIVCPHAVFESTKSVAQLIHPEACMECGACESNCPTSAMMVDSGVGCAAAMIRDALSRKKKGSWDIERESSCCSSDR